MPTDATTEGERLQGGMAVGDLGLAKNYPVSAPPYDSRSLGIDTATPISFIVGRFEDAKDKAEDKIEDFKERHTA